MVHASVRERVCMCLCISQADSRTALASVEYELVNKKSSGEMADDSNIGLSASALQLIVDRVAAKLQEAANKTVASTETGKPPRTDALDGKL